MCCCKILRYLCSLFYCALASVAFFCLKVFVDCSYNNGTFSNCELSECEQKYMWMDLWGSMIFIGPIISIISISNCGFAWWKVLSFTISLSITIAQILSIVGCCLTRKKYKGKGGKKKSKSSKDEKKQPINTEIEV